MAIEQQVRTELALHLPGGLQHGLPNRLRRAFSSLRRRDLARDRSHPLEGSMDEAFERMLGLDAEPDEPSRQPLAQLSAPSPGCGRRARFL